MACALAVASRLAEVPLLHRSYASSHLWGPQLRATGVSATDFTMHRPDTKLGGALGVLGIVSWIFPLTVKASVCIMINTFLNSDETTPSRLSASASPRSPSLLLFPSSSSSSPLHLLDNGSGEVYGTPNWGGWDWDCSRLPARRPYLGSPRTRSRFLPGSPVVPTFNLFRVKNPYKRQWMKRTPFSEVTGQASRVSIFQDFCHSQKVLIQ